MIEVEQSSVLVYDDNEFLEDLDAVIGDFDISNSKDFLPHNIIIDENGYPFTTRIDIGTIN